MLAAVRPSVRPAAAGTTEAGRGRLGARFCPPHPSAPARLRLLRPEAEAVPTGNSGGRLLGLGQRKTPVEPEYPDFIRLAGLCWLLSRAPGREEIGGAEVSSQADKTSPPSGLREAENSQQQRHPRCGHSGPLCRLPAWGPRLTANQPSESLLLPYPADAAGRCGPGQQRPAQWAKG